ncbi:MAG: alpha/beta fold hydrolase [Solirubrobacterales bacterium]
MTAPDRPGWGSSPAPEHYRRTSIAEQATAILASLDSPDEVGEPFSILGEGLGAVVALEIALSRPNGVAAVAMIDPPILGLLTGATEGVSADGELVREAVESGGPEAAYELFLSGDLETLGAGAGRLGELADHGSVAPRSFLVELPAVPDWPLDPARFKEIEARVLLISVGDSPLLLREAADSVVGRIPGAERLELVALGVEATGEAFSLLVEA